MSGKIDLKAIKTTPVDSANTNFNNIDMLTEMASFRAANQSYNNAAYKIQKIHEELKQKSLDVLKNDK